MRSGGKHQPGQPFGRRDEGALGDHEGRPEPRMRRPFTCRPAHLKPMRPDQCSPGRATLTGDGAQGPLSETNPSPPGCHGIRHRSFSREPLLGGFNPRRGSDLVREQFAHTPEMIGQAAGHRGSTSPSPMGGFAQFLMNETEVVGAAKQIHPSVQRLDARSRMPTVARQACQSLTDGSIQAFDQGGIEHAPPT